MTRFRLTLAILMTVLLIGVASFKRFASPQIYVANLAAIKADEAISANAAANAMLAENYADLEGDPATSSTTPHLSNTDLVSRQFMSSYLAMAADGEATDENIDALGNQFADSITTLNTYKQEVMGDLSVVPDSQDRLKTYSIKLATIYEKYQGLTISTVKSAGNISDTSSPRFASSMKALAVLFNRAAVELENIDVPASLADNHLRLVNNYLSSASAFSSLARVSIDSASAYGALATQAENSGEENSILQNIQSALALKGIPLSTSIGL
jgi:hypothetical protein